MVDLKPCPFCGSERASPIPANRKSPERHYPIVRCMGCFIDVPGKTDDFSLDCRTAVTTWNRRADPGIAALEAQLSERVRVKPMEWDCRQADTAIGAYRINVFTSGVIVLLDGAIIPGARGLVSESEAKAAAQADYERRILSALEATQPAPKVTECATEGCEQPATVRFERGGVGSDYCHDCYMRIQSLTAAQEASR